MKKPKIDLREQICRALDDENKNKKCERCGFIGKIGVDLFEHYSIKEGRKIVVCHYCHVEEHRNEKNENITCRAKI